MASGTFPERALELLNRQIREEALCPCSQSMAIVTTNTEHSTAGLL